MPILNRFNQKATCFIVKNQIDGFNLWDTNRSDYKKYKLMNLDQIHEWNKINTIYFLYISLVSSWYPMSRQKHGCYYEKPNRYIF